ncbi:hypothetical protein XELAEV_18022912mg [Xenopus laevis]|uniref:Uncharacterized protein n=1 Tax=Xenopus laevis TaxID=8355 RepID=A0A974D5N2_XENLA|nr:hypothetical protein XELAEV_18022912mg [Xenopus laevis]
MLSFSFFAISCIEKDRGSLSKMHQKHFEREKQNTVFINKTARAVTFNILSNDCQIFVFFHGNIVFQIRSTSVSQMCPTDLQGALL